MVYADEKCADTIKALLLGFETPKRFFPEELETLTAGFSKSLGSGAFGDVFRGVLHDGVLVAVKILKPGVMSNAVVEQFKVEVSVLGRTHHKNVIKLYGFCFEEKMKALVYEFMENESLEKQLRGNQSIAWETLCNIAVGTAKGLSYLHEDCQPRILHYDIKPANILLDSKFTPKVGDFGLAKLLMQDATHITETGYRGTPNYWAPEIRMPYSPVTDTCDVFSFGVTLFDIVGRRRHLLIRGQNWFPFRVWRKFQREKHEEIMEECGIQKIDREQARRILLIALRCVQFEPKDRPSMSHVVRFLEGTEEVELPKPFWHMGASSVAMEEEEDEVDKVSRRTLGPWGGGVTHWDDGVFAGIKKIQVFRGVKGDVRSIQVWYCGEDGESISTTRHGYKEAHTSDTFELAYPSEYLMRVTGFYGYEFGNTGLLLVRSLCFFTNKKIYGPFGDERGIYFTSENNGKDGKVVGFHGREGWYLDALGTHMEYDEDHLEKPKENDEADVSRTIPTTVGPWGGTGGGDWDDGVSNGIKKIEIHRGTHGDVRSVEIWYCGKDEDPIWSQRHGFEDTRTTETIELDYPSEYLVRVTGFHGNEFGDSGFHVVSSLCFFTNKKSYGPFGRENGSRFSTEKDGKDGKVIGFHGKSGWYLDAIGMHMDYS